MCTGPEAGRNAEHTAENIHTDCQRAEGQAKRRDRKDDQGRDRTG